MSSTFEKAFHLSNFIFPKGGTCLEFGVYVGNTYMYQVQNILNKYTNTKLIGFDSWQGLPPETDGIWYPDRHATGKFSTTKDVVINKLKNIKVEPNDKRFRLIDGFFSESLTKELQSTIKDLIFVNIDVDIHSSTIELLNFIKPLLRPGVVIYWDDWKDPQDKCESEWGEHRAWSEWYSKQNDIKVETIDVNPRNQRSMVITETYDCGLSISEIETITKKVKEL